MIDLEMLAPSRSTPCDIDEQTPGGCPAEAHVRV